MFVRVTLESGEKLVSEFTKLAGLQRYAGQVMGGGRPFNGWRVVATRHPHSGEPNLQRTRVLVSGRSIVQMEEVERKPDAAPDSLDPQDFTPVVNVQQGEQGLWTAPDGEEAVENAVPGARYPVHMDPRDLRRYVILRVAQDGGQGEVRYYFQQDTVTDSSPLPGMEHEAPLPGDGDEDY